jgi:uncharacterized integral membrane protein
MKSKRRIRWHLIAVLGLVVLFVIVIFQNTEVVKIRLLFWTLSMSRIILLLFSLLVGFVVGVYVMWRGKRREQTYARITSKEESN